MNHKTSRIFGLGLLLILRTPAHAAMPIVTDGKPNAIIVTSDRPGAVAKYAAEELASHIAKAAGVTLVITTESALTDTSTNRIYVGDSQAARAAVIDVGKLAAEAFVLRTTDHALFIVGNDKNDDPLDPDTRAGTLWGVYEWLERTLNVRWLWPGELGAFVPKTQMITASDVDETIPPAFFQRKIRPGLGFTSEHPAMGFSAAAAEDYSRAQTVFLRRHRMGRSFAMSNSHAFTDWWKRNGKEHPEWFQLRDDGKRGPRKSTSRFSMCVSNPEFQKQIIDQWSTHHTPKPGTKSFINACENDILGSCTCAVCQALDGPAPADYLTYYSPTSKMADSRFVSDRYAHFWLALQQQAARIDPNATVLGYVYFNYFQAPTTDIKLNDHILLGFCPSGGWFPRSPAEDTWMKAQWDGWRRTGARLFMRTNHLLDGYTMPFIFAHQFASDFQHAAKNGMVATDFDSLTGQWATQGPTLYVASCLHVRPEASADTLLSEYYSAFGAAATKVKACFDYWENYTNMNRETTSHAFETLEASRWRSWAKAADTVFPASSFVPAETMLQEALITVKADPEAAARVQFLQTGLTHAKLCARLASQLTLAHPLASKEQTKALLDELITFRRAHAREWIANFNHCAWVEDQSWRLSDETKKAPDLYP